jgi:endonuclease/exonuclease/phosphatase (EEP) superfamily protein YafD
MWQQAENTQQLQGQQQQQQQQVAGTAPQPEPPQYQLLQQTLQLDNTRFQALVQQAPFILNFTPHTLQLTVEALSEAVHCSKWAVCSILELRPSILLAPYEPAQTLQQLAAVLDTSSRHTGELRLHSLCVLSRLEVSRGQYLSTAESSAEVCLSQT